MVVGRRLHHRVRSWRAQASPTKPEHGSPAISGLSGPTGRHAAMAAGAPPGAVFAHPRAPSGRADARVRPIFLTHM